MSKLARLILPLLAAATVFGLFRLWSFGQHAVAEDYLGSARQRFDAEEPDLSRVLQELARGIELARDTQNREQVEEALLLRVEVFRRLGHWAQAIEDYDTLLAGHRPDDPELLLEAARLAVRNGQYDLALERARRSIEVRLEDPLAWNELGEIHLELAAGLVQDLRPVLESHLPAELVESALHAAGLAAALAENSARRGTELERLEDLCKTSDVREEVGAAVDLASEHTLEARRAFLRSLQLEPSPRAAAGLQRILRRAEAYEEAAELGWFVLRAPGVGSSSRMLFETARNLDLLERPQAARPLLQNPEDPTKPPVSTYALEPEEVPTLCRMYYRLEMWEELSIAAERLGKQVEWRKLPLQHVVTFYTAMALVGKGETGLSKPALWSIRPDPQAFPGAFNEALLARWKIMADDTNPAAELSTLEAITYYGGETRAGEPFATEIGEAYLRLARLYHERNQPRRAEIKFTHALRLLGPRWRTLYKEWEEIGRASSQTHARTIESFLQSLRTNPTDLPHHGFGAYEYFVAALTYATDFPSLARTTLGTLQRDFPDLPPAMELLGDLQAQTEDHVGAARTWVRLGEISGASESLIARLSALPEEAFEGDLRLRALLLDPEALTLPAMVREMARSGHVELALKTLEDRGLPELDVELRTLAAELYANKKRWRQTLMVLEEGTGADEVVRRAPGLSLQAALWGAGGDTTQALERMLERLLAAPLDYDPSLQRAIDAALSEGHHRVVLRLCEHLDRGGPSPELLLRRAVAEIVLLQRDQAAETLSRVEAFVEGPAPALGHLLMLVDRRDWEAFEAEAHAYARLTSEADPYQRALVYALRGDARVAQQLLSELRFEPERAPQLRLAELACEAMTGFTAPPDDDLTDDAQRGEVQRGGDEDDPLERLARALLTDEHPKAPDPKVILTLLLALETSPYPAWVVARIQDLPPHLAQNPWAIYLAALGTHALGNDGIAERLFALLTTTGFEAAWYPRERLASQRLGEGSTAMLRLRAERMASVGARGIGFRELVLFQMRGMLQFDKVDEALEHVGRALATTPGDVVLQRERAELLVQAGRGLDALEAYRELLDSAQAEDLHELTRETLALLQDLHAQGTISDAGWWCEVEALEAQSSDDPAVVRELIERTIARGDSRSIDLAWRRFERFRERTGGAALESLRDGATGRWFELVRERDPERAREMVRDELVAHPASPTLWRLWSGALVSLGHRRQSLTDLNYLTPLLPDPELWRTATRLMADLGTDPALVELAARRTARLSGTEMDAELKVLPILSAYRCGEAPSGSQLRQLEGAFEASLVEGERSRAATVGRALALTLLRARQRKFDERAVEVLELTRGIASDALLEDLAEAYLAIARARLQ